MKNHHVKAKKSFGQHFLTEESIGREISEAISTPAGTRVLEIGPGKGFLTKYLTANKNIDLRVVEADQDMVAYLSQHKILDPEQIIFIDFMKLSMQKVFDGEQFTIIGNFPYNISSQILIKMINHYELVPELVGMFQKEVADRVVSPPGSKTYGVISVLVQAYYTGGTIINVGPQFFDPPPKVNSSVIRLVRKSDTELGCNPKLFRHVVKSAFSSRRKMLRNTLKPIIDDPSILDDPRYNERPEQLSVEQFVEITNLLEKHIKNNQ